MVMTTVRHATERCAGERENKIAMWYSKAPCASMGVGGRAELGSSGLASWDGDGGTTGLLGRKLGQELRDGSDIVGYEQVEGAACVRGARGGGGRSCHRHLGRDRPLTLELELVPLKGLLSTALEVLAIVVFGHAML